MTVTQLGRVIMGRPEGEERGNGTEEILDTVMTEAFATDLGTSENAEQDKCKNKNTLTWACHF